MLVDCHMHLATPEAMAAYNEPFASGAAFYEKSSLSALHGRVDRAVSISDTVDELRRCGAVAAVVVNVDASFRWKTKFPNEKMVQTLAPYGDFFIPFASVDPRYGKESVAELRRAFADLGCVGLKIHPSYQEVYPNDRELMYPLYELCSEFGAPILFHAGLTMLSSAPIKYSQPIYLDEVAIDFPKMKIIIAHWGWPWIDEVLAILWRSRNVYVDLSGHLPRRLSPAVWHYMQMPGLAERFLFGSDFPFLKPSEMLKAYEEFTQWHCPLCQTTEYWKEGVKESFLGQNFLRMISKE